MPAGLAATGESTRQSRRDGPGPPKCGGHRPRYNLEPFEAESIGQIQFYWPLIPNPYLFTASQAIATASAGVAARFSPGRSQVTFRAMVGFPSFRAMAASEMVP